MRQVMMMHVCMILVVALVCSTDGMVRLYAKQDSRLSTKRITPVVWSTSMKDRMYQHAGSLVYVDIPRIMLVDMDTGSYGNYKLKGSTARYAKLSCKAVV